MGKERTTGVQLVITFSGHIFYSYHVNMCWNIDIRLVSYQYGTQSDQDEYSLGVTATDDVLVFALQISNDPC